MRGNTFLADRFDSLAIKDGLVEARNLPAGDYDLWQKVTGEKIRVRITDGAAVAGHLLGKLRTLETAGLKPTQIASVAANDDLVVVKLKDASKFARVHVFATRYLPAFNAFANLGKVRDAELTGVVPTRPESVYLTGRNIGDEYRYVLDRRGMRKYPGNMLDRPQLLLNPWAIRSTETGEQHGSGRRNVPPQGRADAEHDAARFADREPSRLVRRDGRRRLRQPRFPRRADFATAQPRSGQGRRDRHRPQETRARIR